MHNPRGNVIAFSRREVIIGGLHVTSASTKSESIMIPRLLVYVKNGSRRMRDQFSNACKRLGIDINLNDEGERKAVQLLDGQGRPRIVCKACMPTENDPHRPACVECARIARSQQSDENYTSIADGVAVYDVAGTPESLQALIELPCILDAHYVVNVGVPRGCGKLNATYPGPRPPREVAVKAATEKRRIAAENVKHWEQVAAQTQVDEYGCTF